MRYSALAIFLLGISSIGCQSLRTEDSSVSENRQLASSPASDEQSCVRDIDTLDLKPKVQSIGSPSRSIKNPEAAPGGSLMKPTCITDQGPGFIKLQLHREQNFGSRTMINELVKAAEFVSAKYSDDSRFFGPKRSVLQIGNIAKQKGGPNGYSSSHQNGNDVDLVYYDSTGTTQDPNIEDFEKKFVHLKSNAKPPIGPEDFEVSPDFDFEQNLDFMQELARSGFLMRFILSPILMHALCEEARERRVIDLPEMQLAFKAMSPKKNPESYQNEEPPYKSQDQLFTEFYLDHNDHFHVRFKCPPGIDGEKCLNNYNQIAPEKRTSFCL